MTRTRIGRLLFAVALALALTTLALACGGDDDDESSDGAATTETTAATTESETETGDVADLNLVDPTKLTVGMSLQFEPQMYLDDSGDPAGYDVVLVEELAEKMGVELDIQNLDFNGLIPGLVSKRFDMVSVGLSATPERKESVDFSREYVPYVQVLAAAADDETEATIEAFNTSDKAITSLQGSTAEKLVGATFPEAQSKSFPDQNAAFLEVSTGRADAIVVENYLLAQFNESNDDA
ncbi:MAG: transporter substrate-binding domain-containing protein, partial [Gaiellaceae bacterium]